MHPSRQARSQSPEKASSRATGPQARTGPSSRSQNAILNLQSMIGNQAVLSLLVAESDSGSFDKKLAINTPGDLHEQEAERVSEQVMSTPAPQSERKCICGGTCSKCQAD